MGRVAKTGSNVVVAYFLLLFNIEVIYEAMLLQLSFFLLRELKLL